MRSALQLGLMLAFLHTFMFQLDQALHQQQSMQQIKACTLQLVEQGIQQRAMQEALEDIITICN